MGKILKRFFKSTVLSSLESDINQIKKLISKHQNLKNALRFKRDKEIMEIILGRERKIKSGLIAIRTRIKED
jgi:hypothetical protein